MKITVTLTEPETKGIKAYLKEVDGIEKPKKEDVANFVNSMVGAIHSPKESVSDFIRRFEK